jgi:hypothetical protein
MTALAIFAGLLYGVGAFFLVRAHNEIRNARHIQDELTQMVRETAAEKKKLEEELKEAYEEYQNLSERHHGLCSNQHTATPYNYYIREKDSEVCLFEQCKVPAAEGEFYVTSRVAIFNSGNSDYDRLRAEELLEKLQESLQH